MIINWRDRNRTFNPLTSTSACQGGNPGMPTVSAKDGLGTPLPPYTWYINTETGEVRYDVRDEDGNILTGPDMWGEECIVSCVAFFPTPMQIEWPKNHPAESVLGLLETTTKENGDFRTYQPRRVTAVKEGNDEAE